ISSYFLASAALVFAHPARSLNSPAPRSHNSSKFHDTTWQPGALSDKGLTGSAQGAFFPLLHPAGHAALRNTKRNGGSYVLCVPSAQAPFFVCLCIAGVCMCPSLVPRQTKRK